ncbi:antibiotic biosynthesis monooxygenase [Rhizohabitans arisaemae]|uniref:antibiotic biosynthesis monooxygenase n=1 Tax=Rhizohabitans arisaemae TaxID=2720610 RepID=UPI0024B13E71|nr:antibiotic biosynthesis monooxygenase [Rhizohabitans arisaemae]
MYARYSTLEFDADKRGEVVGYFGAEGTAGPSGRPGWRGSVVLESEVPGRLRTVTFWDTAQHFTDFHSGQAHSGINNSFAELGVRVTEREGADTVLPPVIAGGHIRAVTVRIAEERTDEVEAFWRSRGRALILGQPGAVRAEAFWTGTEFTLLMEWVDEDAALTFVASQDHVEFANGMGTGPDDVVSRRGMNRIKA